MAVGTATFGKVIAGTIGGLAASKLVSQILPAHKWERTSYQGTTVSLRGGLEVAGAVCGGAIALLPTPLGVASTTVALSGAIAGWIDDHYEAKFSAKGKGFRGHLGALRNGQVTSGLVKILLIGGSAGVAALHLTNTCTRGKLSLNSVSTIGYWGADIATSTVLIASTANLFNLLDLRPGRALKAGMLVLLPIVWKNPLAAGLSLAAAFNLPPDLAGKTMLGDLGANAFGGAIGVILATQPKLWQRSLAAGATVGLMLASEKISFSKVIASNDVLRWLDELGRAKPRLKQE